MQTMCGHVLKQFEDIGNEARCQVFLDHGISQDSGQRYEMLFRRADKTILGLTVRIYTACVKVYTNKFKELGYGMTLFSNDDGMEKLFADLREALG